MSLTTIEARRPIENADANSAVRTVLHRHAAHEEDLRQPRVACTLVAVAYILWFTMSNYSYRQKAPAPVLAGSMDHEYDYGPSSPLQDYHVSPSVAAAAAAGYNISSPREPEGGNTVDGDEALLDLAQLEELHKEAEKMKALGNKHMATQVRRTPLFLL